MKQQQTKMKCADCQRPVEREGFSRCDICCDRFGNISSYSEVCAMDDESYHNQHFEGELEQ